MTLLFLNIHQKRGLLGRFRLSVRPYHLPAVQDTRKVGRLAFTLQFTLLRLSRALLIILLGALMLDMATVRFMTPTRAPLTQDDLLSLSLPAMSLSLAITANIFSYFQNQPASPPPSHETAIEHSAIGRDPYIGGSFQQTSFPDLGTSRPYLLGSPLNEDSTRIWENDD